MAFNKPFSWSILVMLVPLAAAASTYRAAAVEFAPERAANSSITAAETLALRLRNVERFVPFVSTAKANHTQIIVFPEYGITGDGTALEDADFSRDLATQFGEQIPEPNSLVSRCDTPCTGCAVTTELACMAKRFEIVLVANMIDVVPCTSGAAGCTDGRHQYNTAVVFDETGALISKYWKRHLYTEESKGLDPSPARNDTVFQTSFGVQFGVLICFDLVFEIAPPSSIRHFVFPTDWVNFAPWLRGQRSVDFQRIWSFTHQKNLIASNYGGFGRDSSGSGLWQQGKALAEYYNPTTEPKSKLLIADMEIDIH